MRKTAVLLLASLLLASLPAHGGHVGDPGMTGDEDLPDDDMTLAVHDCTADPSDPEDPEHGVGDAGNGIEAVWVGTGSRVLATGADPEPLVLVETVLKQRVPTPATPATGTTPARLALTFDAGGTETESVVQSTDDWEANVSPVTGEGLLAPDWYDARPLTLESTGTDSFVAVEVGYRFYRLFGSIDLTVDAFEAVTSHDAGAGYVVADTTAPPTGGCTGHDTNDEPIAVDPPKPAVDDVTFDPASPDRTKAIAFEPVLDVAGGDPDWTGYSFQWTFTNGADVQTSSAARPTLTFTEFAPVTVALQFTNDLGIQSPARTLANLVTFDNLAPVTDFTVSPRAPELGDTVTFTDATVDPEDDDVTSWSWTFGDGATSTSQNPTHEYTQVGAYDVTLTTTDEHGASNARSLTLFVCDEADQSQQACRPPNVGPRASFTVDTNRVEQGGTVAFTDTSTDPDGTIEAWHWDFGDGSDPATTKDPTHAFGDVGTFQVTLTVTDDDGLQATRALPVRVLLAPEDDDGDGQDLLPAPLAAFDVSPAKPVVGKAVTFTDNTTAETDLVAWTWFFGDGSGAGDGREVAHTYQEAGTYLVRLTVTDERGVRDTTERTVVVGTGSSDEDAPGLPVVALLALVALAAALRRRIV